VTRHSPGFEGVQGRQTRFSGSEFRLLTLLRKLATGVAE